MENIEKTVLLKNNVELNLVFERADNYYTILAITPEQKQVAKMSFKLNAGTCYLNRIEIEDINFAHIGLGTKMLEFMEEVALMARCNNVDGKFYPFGDLGEYAKNFYEKNGYQIYKDGYETYISKYLSKEMERTY